MVQGENIYTSKFTGEEIDAILSKAKDATSMTKMSLADYLKLKESGKLDPETWYSIYTDGQLSALYVGSVPVLETVDSSAGSIKNMLESEYLALRASGGTTPGVSYYCYADYSFRRLMSIYVGTTLIAHRGDSISVGFPYVFPITFV